MNTISTDQHGRMGKYSTYQASYDHAQAPYQLEYIPVYLPRSEDKSNQALEASFGEANQ